MSSPQFLWDGTNRNKLEKLWNAKESVPIIAAELGCTELDVRYQAVIVMKLPPRFPIKGEGFSRPR